ncbi:MAG TPA: hypothetical protein VK846_13805 [Candidatus Limnocylindria bacterium]|nr:hypothetical protein [Candidatus Limnocylindria bacterium]
MKTEELTREPTTQAHHFDAHEFDGLRDGLEHEAESAFGKLDEFVHAHPVVCMALAGMAGMAVGRILRR